MNTNISNDDDELYVYDYMLKVQEQNKQYERNLQQTYNIEGD